MVCNLEGITFEKSGADVSCLTKRRRTGRVGLRSGARGGGRRYKFYAHKMAIKRNGESCTLTVEGITSVRMKIRSDMELPEIVE